MQVRTPKNTKDLDQQIVQEWRDLGNEWPTQLWKIARWALQSGRAEYSNNAQEKMLARRIGASLREEYYRDLQGRRVRKKHCYPVITESPTGLKKQQFFWCDLETADPDEVRASVQYRRGQIVSDAVQLKTDVDSYNDNNKAGVEIELGLDLSIDVDERMQDTEYRPTPPPEE
ncbi:hypothetical protein [Gimesia algae]|uniref:Uncharacterized protein n=1 Tax=Gimesia algae TaxID=2527971 RepID=A0A517VMR6_9PLAN|nr:hypothetical protein [Gimesia algae]QDT94286.1 hypothetical protein Pan161_59810 [Gimesia algae]